MNTRGPRFLGQHDQWLFRFWSLGKQCSQFFHNDHESGRRFNSQTRPVPDRTAGQRLFHGSPFLAPCLSMQARLLALLSRWGSANEVTGCRRPFQPAWDQSTTIAPVAGCASMTEITTCCANPRFAAACGASHQQVRGIQQITNHQITHHIHPAEQVNQRGGLPST